MRGRGARHNTSRGLTVLELMLALGVLGVLLALGHSQYSGYRERVALHQAIGDISAMSVAITSYWYDHGRVPPDLDAVGFANATDPWGNPYHYTDLTGKGGRGKARKDKRLNPLNSDFDLFSAGKNGVFKTQISHRDSLDDVLRARDGAFVDIAEKF